MWHWRHIYLLCLWRLWASSAEQLMRNWECEQTKSPSMPEGKMWQHSVFWQHHHVSLSCFDKWSTLFSRIHSHEALCTVLICVNEFFLLPKIHQFPFCSSQSQFADTWKPLSDFLLSKMYFHYMIYSSADINADEEHVPTCNSTTSWYESRVINMWTWYD